MIDSSFVYWLLESEYVKRQVENIALPKEVELKRIGEIIDGQQQVIEKEKQVLEKLKS